MRPDLEAALLGGYTTSGGLEPAAAGVSREGTLRVRNAALWREGRWSEHEGYEVEVRDTVGAGDSYTAALALGLLAGHDPERIVEFAHRVADYVFDHAFGPS